MLNTLSSIVLIPFNFILYVNNLIRECDNMNLDIKFIYSVKISEKEVLNSNFYGDGCITSFSVEDFLKHYSHQPKSNQIQQYPLRLLFQ